MPTPQSPLQSGFGATSTAGEVIQGIDLTGKVAIVTGGYSGIGIETTRVLAGAGARVIVPVRTPDKAARNLAGLDVETLPLDLLEPASIDAFAEAFLASGRPLHILIDSAGIMMLPEATHDRRGYELQFAANHLGHFQLAARLWPALKAANGARVISISSRGHRYAPVDFDDPNWHTRPYNKFEAYGQSKTANVLFAVALDTLGEPYGVRAFALHPGAIPTELSRYLTDEDLAYWKLIRHPDGTFSAQDPSSFKTVPQGAATSVWCATSPMLDGKGGVYCEDCDIAVVKTEGTDGVRRHAIDPEIAERLWAMSEEMAGVKFK
ncbi:MAG TPA: SDR family NAD(P)-dependent oxidoreductase [Asticcacaulis sp.]|nr:SDR family NAD(P)-dependent oxidoreductase [Asticcacaulis sp.]